MSRHLSNRGAGRIKHRGSCCSITTKYDKPFKTNNNEKNVPTGIIILKILALKEINSTFGFTKGDSFLINCLSRIRQGLLPGDIIYKISENEFLIYYSKIINEGHIILAANKLY